MKKIAVLFFLSGVVVFSLQNCKPDPTPPNSSDPDSLYVGTHYSFSTLNPYPFKFPSISNSYKDSLTYEGIELGRRLFYDKHLSSTGQLACASCHKQEFAFSDAGFAKSTNVFGPTKRNAPSIENLLWSNSIFWDGRVSTLADQAKDAFHGEQNLDIPGAITYLKNDSVYARLFKKAFGRPGDVTEEKIYKAVQQFMMTLISSNSHFDKVQRGQESFTAAEDSGYAIFLDLNKGDCTHCHSFGNTYLFTDNKFTSNGLDVVATVNDYTDKGRGDFTNNVNDNGTFRNPSIRNVALTAPYMHDGRFQTLQQVIDFYSDSVQNSGNVSGMMFIEHPDGRRHFTPDEKYYLLEFLRSLTDTTFTHNPAFSNPF